MTAYNLRVREFDDVPNIRLGPVTMTVLERLQELLAAGDDVPAEQICDSILTAVANLEVNLVVLRTATQNVYSRVLDLELRLHDSGCTLPTSDLPQITDWQAGDG